MSSGMYEITVPVVGGNYETLHTDRIVTMEQINSIWCISVEETERYYYLNANSTIRTPEGKTYGMDKFPMLAELINLETSLEEL